MSVFDRLAIGTANWGQVYGHRGVTCPREEQEKIVFYLMSAGIDTIHTKEAYHVDLSWLPTYFDIVYGDQHGFYDPSEVPHVHEPWPYMNVPYSPFDRRWETWLAQDGHQCAEQIHVRSVFCQGKVFTGAEPVFVRFRKYAGQLHLCVGTLCLLFCLLNPHVDKVIIGVDSEQQLRENLRFFHRLEGFGVDDPSVIDPRLWEKAERGADH